MSAAPALRPQATSHTRSVKRMFSVVSAQPNQRKLTLPIIVMVCVLLLIISAPLFINTQLAMLSYDIHDNTVALNQLNEQNEALQVRLDEAASAERLRNVATKAGMVPAPTSGQITLKTNEVVTGVVATK